MNIFYVLLACWQIGLIASVTEPTFSKLGKLWIDTATLGHTVRDVTNNDQSEKICRHAKGSSDNCCVKII